MCPSLVEVVVQMAVGVEMANYHPYLSQRDVGGSEEELNDE